MPSYNTIFQNLRNMWTFFEPLYFTTISISLHKILKKIIFELADIEIKIPEQELSELSTGGLICKGGVVIVGEENLTNDGIRGC